MTASHWFASRRSPLPPLAIAVLLAALAAGTSAADRFDVPGAFNPILPGYFADPTVRKFGDTYCIYSTTDGNSSGRGPSQVWLSDDFVNWTLCPMNWPLSKTENYWAPEVFRSKDGRYYLYFSQPCEIFGAVSDTPSGPWQPLGGGNGLVVKNNLVPNVITLDSHTFEDQTGDIFMYWGTWGIYPNSGAGWGKLNPDMKSFAALGKVPNTQIKDFFEAPFLIEKDGLYYFMYSAGSCHDSTYRVQYAVGNKPHGDFKMGPNNPILTTNSDKTVDGPGHHSVLKEGNDYYIVYHRHDLPFTPNGLTRQVCADRMHFGEPGEIKAIVPTHKGIGLLGKNTEPGPNLAFGKKVTASSYYNDTLRNHEYKPAYAVDDNNATIWRPGDNKMGHWLQVDLGSPQRIRRVLTQFEYATWYYQYRLETSPDGVTWETFADREKNTRWGSPLVDRGDVIARYLRITVTGTEKLGLFGSIWNLKVFSTDREDRLEKIANKAFATFIAPEQAKLPQAAWKATSSPDRKPLIQLDAAGLPLGSTVTSWKNVGSLGGTFDSQAHTPTVGLAAGRKAVRFSNGEFFKASFPSPVNLAGNNSFTVSAWVNNPEIGESECLVSWAGRGGPDAATAQVNYGTHPRFGAVGHWGFADMGFNGKVPEAEQWHHLAVVFDGVVERVYVDGTLVNAAAKMLLMNHSMPVYLGASMPNTEFYDGYLASLEIYDTPFSEAAVAQLAADMPVADVLQHLESARLDYGPLAEWANKGASTGAFKAGVAAPTVEDVAGRSAVRFRPGHTMMSTAGPMQNAGNLTVVATVRSAKAGVTAPLQLVAGDGKSIPVSLTLPDERWHQLVITSDALSLDGTLLAGSRIALPATLAAIQLGGESFDGALSRVQTFRRTLTAAEILDLSASWKREWNLPQTRFAAAPKALGPGMISMQAQRPAGQITGVQFHFAETSGNAGGQSSGWINEPFYLNEGLKADTTYAYQLKVRDGDGNVFTVPGSFSGSTASDQFESFNLDTSKPHNFLTQGVGKTGWSGLIQESPGAIMEAVAIENNALLLKSKGTAWDGNPARGPFLYHEVAGDFVVEVTVADYAGLAKREPVGNCDGGLMIRLPEPAQGENLVALSFFPPWNQGNMITSMTNGGRFQKGTLTGFNAQRHLQIIRVGSQIHCRVSDDGMNWREMPESPVTRPDLAGKPLQVGVAHASNGDVSSYISFSDFQLTRSK